MAQIVKNPPATPDTWIPLLGQEDALKKETAWNFCLWCLYLRLRSRERMNFLPKKWLEMYSGTDPIIHLLLGLHFRDSRRTKLTIFSCGTWKPSMNYWSQLESISISSVQFSSVAQTCLTLCNPMDRSRPGFSVHHQLPESTQTHIHWWCHPAISSSVAPFSSCPQSLPASGSFPMSQHFTWGGQCTGVSASASVLPMNTQDWSSSGWTGWISLQSKGLSRVFSNTTVQKHQFFDSQLSSQSNSHIHTSPLEKP